MAIGKITRGNGFYGLMKYLLDEEKSPQIIGGCMVGSKPDDIAREFRQVANLRPRVEKPVRHFSISFAPGDGNVDDLVKETIAYRVLEGLGYKDCQFMAIGHRRDQAGHDEVHNHDHIHIVANAVTLDGEHVDGSFDRYEIQKVLREVEKDFGLRQIKSSLEVMKEKIQAESIARNSGIAPLIANSLKDRPSLEAWLERLSADGIDVRFNLSRVDKRYPDRERQIKGITFIKDGEAYKGSSIGAAWSKSTHGKKDSTIGNGILLVSEIISVTASDIPQMEAANRASEKHPAKLNELDRIMFDRAVEMALLKLNGNVRFKNGRADIRKTETLKVHRMRPDKIMFEAKEVNGKWEPVGFPQIEKQDVQLLERMNSANGMEFAAVEQGDKRNLKTNLQEPIFTVETEYGQDDDDFPPESESLIDRLQTAIDSAAEEATHTVLEFTECLAQRGVKTRITDSANGEIEITYQLEGVKFEGTQLTDASLSLLKSARDLTFDRLNDLDRINEIKVDSDIEDFAPPTWAEIEEEGRAADQAAAETLIQSSLTEPPEIQSKYPIEFSDISNYLKYLNSREYKQQLPKAERGDLGRKTSEIIDPLMSEFRTIARAAAGANLPASHPYFRSFKTEMDVSEQDRIGIEKARDWVGRQPITPVEKENRWSGLER
jgi:Relaxase/Mobilisation nuclease domain